MLSCYRILDLTDEKGFFCGKILGDLGANVIKIERPGGDAARKIGPFYHDIPDPDKSLYWLASNANKQGITLNIETIDGQDIFRKLVKSADVVIESFDPGYLTKLGLGYSELTKINSNIILTSISGFGQEGPFRDYKSPEIIVWALSGLLYQIGDDDRPPVMPSYHHGYMIAAINAAISIMIALFHRSITGHGQNIDVSAQQSLVHASSMEVQGQWAIFNKWERRHGRKRWPVEVKTGEITYEPVVWQCKDGDITYLVHLGSLAQGNVRLINWMKSEGYDPGPLEKWDWEKMDWTAMESIDQAEEVFEKLGNFFLSHTRAEIIEKAKQENLTIGPVFHISDLIDFNQLIERDFWKGIEHSNLDCNITYPGGFVKLSDGKCEIRCRAPLIGEHNDEIYKGELGFSAEDVLTFKHKGVI